jgi:hypothetical protein
MTEITLNFGWMKEIGVWKRGFVLLGKVKLAFWAWRGGLRSQVIDIVYNTNWVVKIES